MCFLTTIIFLLNTCYELFKVIKKIDENNTSNVHKSPLDFKRNYFMWEVSYTILYSMSNVVKIW